jgi:hypothetical protein
MIKKYELVLDDKKEISGITLYRIRALVAIAGVVSPGQLGGYIEREKNLSHEGNAWVSGSAMVYGGAVVSDNAWVSGSAMVSGSAWVYGNARVSGHAWVFGNAWVFGHAWVFGNAWVSDNARVSGSAWVFGNAWVSDNARVSGSAAVEKTCHYMNISQMKFNLTFTPSNVFGGCRLFSHDEFKNLTIDQCQSEWREGELENYKAFQALYWKQMEINDPVLTDFLYAEMGSILKNGMRESQKDIGLTHMKFMKK